MKSGVINLAVYSSNGFQETFTKAHRDLLPVKYVITEGTPPRMVNGRPMLPMDKWAVLIRKLKGLFGIEILPLDPLNAFLSRNKVDVFIAEFGMAGAAIVSSCKKFNVPLIVNFYGIDAFGRKLIQDNKESYRKMFEYSVFISAQSQSIKRQLISLGCSESKIIVNSCPPSELFFDVQPEMIQPVLISVGRFVEKKAPSKVINAFQIISERMPEARLIMVGDGPLFDETIALVEKLGLQDSVRFTGRLNQDQQLNEMKNASVFIQHSVTATDGDSEGLPVAIMEASAMGLPVVSTNHSGIPEAVEDKKTGFLVREGDFSQMADYCLDLLKSNELRGKMGEAGREKMKKEFTMKLHISRMMEIIEKAK